MEPKHFLDNEKRKSRKLLVAEGMRLERKPACYVIENRETGSEYVGSTKNISARINGHRWRLFNNQHPNKNLQKEFNDCEDKNNFIIHISPEETVDIARDREQMSLDKNFGSDHLLNISNNARAPALGYDRTLTIEKMKKTKNTEEYRAKTSRDSIARWEDPVIRKKTIASMGQNVVVDGIRYGSVREASRETGAGIKTIRDRLVNDTCSLGDVKGKRPVICNGVEFESVTDAAKAHGIKCNTMIARLKNSGNNWKNFNYK